MPRFIHKQTGSIVECSEGVAATLPDDYVPADEHEAEQSKPVSRTSKK